MIAHRLRERECLGLSDSTPDVTHPLRRSRMLSAQEVAAALSVSLNWVYRHKNALRGFQPAPGCALSFSETVIRQILEGTYGLSVEKRALEGSEDDCRAAKNKDLPYKGRSQKMGGRAGRRIVAGPDKHNLLA